MLDEDNTKKSQGEDKTVADPVSATSFDPKTQVHRSASPPPTRTSLYLFGGDGSSVAAVPVKRIKPFDPGSVELIFSNWLLREANSHSQYKLQIDAGTVRVGVDIGQSLGKADHAKVSLFFREGKHFQEAYAAAMTFIPQDLWYVDVYKHSILVLLADWVSKYCCSVSWTWSSTIELSKFLGFISQLTNYGWKSNSKNWFGLCCDIENWITFLVVGFPMSFDDSATSGLVDTLPRANNQIESKISLPKAEPMSRYCSKIVDCSENSDIEVKKDNPVNKPT